VTDPAAEKDQRTAELEHQIDGLRRRVEKLGGDAVRAEYEAMHLTQEVRRSREAFGFLTGFQHSVSRARSIGALYEAALKAIIGELWFKRAAVLERDAAARVFRTATHLGYGSGEEPSELSTEWVDCPGCDRPRLVNGETEPDEWVEALRESVGMPYFVWIPGDGSGTVETILVAGTLTEDGAQAARLTDHDMELLGSVGAILGVGRMNILARQRLERQVRYESLLHGISELLLRDFDKPTRHFDEVIRRVGTAWGLDRVRLLSRRADDGTVVVTHDWRSPVVQVENTSPSYPLDSTQRWRDAMRNGHPIRIDDAETLDPHEAETLESQGIRSLFLLPISVDNAIVAWSSFEQCATRRTWGAEDTQLLEVIAGLVARAISREQEVEERAHLEAEYHHSKKMEAVGQLAGGVAHDFNNLLTTIQGYAQLLMSRLPEEYRNMPGLKEIVMASERAAGLTRQLLTVSRKDKAITGSVNVNTVVNDMMKLLSRTLGDEVEMNLDLASELEPILGDHQQICQVVMNLAINARDAMPKGGKLKVATRQFPVVSAMARRFAIPGVEQCQMIEVTDTGHGMDGDTKERIFEPFFTTKEAGRGTGLGLAIVFGTVRRHGGFIDVASEPGKGTIFSVFLPVRTPVSEKQEVVQTKAAGGSETILVVEDDEGVRSMICEVLEPQGYHVLSAVNGRDAIEKLSTEKERVALVLTDLVMPEMNGYDMWKSITQSGYDIPVIVMSGYPKEKGSEDIFKQSAAFLQKPFGPGEISRVVRTTLDSMIRPQDPRPETPMH